ncbi:hypothetical protein GO685_02300 [Wolbachia endosymbiont of Madathamugadia hiepei]|uniref:leucine-rich repeat domain-containing protein n=1 Tax=Wolbachia endosymbiont of Madathamugadia hiepei TaxID=1241303 RepID=UPI00158C90FC|nr:leucine-rich repeat domain-containing protein [Wolbachia endosymbiont of Madathamugadia hiepei]NUX01343.1 hypothetical protein [Wolbachia endosymbiont of Madathamugadia hiepei]
MSKNKVNFSKYVDGDRLSLNGNELFLDNIRLDVKKLVNFLKDHRDITYLTLNSCKIGNEDIRELANLTHLKLLDLSDNEIDDKGEPLAPLINLEWLDLSHYFVDDIDRDFQDEIGDGGIEDVARYLRNFEEFLSGNKIGDKGVEALARYLRNLKELNLSGNKIGDKGTEALAKLPNLTELDLSSNKVDCEGYEALARSFYVKYVRGDFRIHHDVFKFFVDLYYKNQSIDNLSEDSVKEAIFNVARHGQGEKIVQYTLAKPNEYPFLINSRDEYGHTLYHYYTHSPEMQTFLFEHGLIPEKETELQNILQDRQSTHRTPVVNQVNFFTKKLVESIKASKKELEQAATSYVKNIPKLLEQYQSDPVRLRLLSLSDSEKKNVMENVLSNGSPIPNDQDFIKTVINKAKQALEEQYLIGDTARLQYDYARDDAKVTIPESIGYVKLHIDKLSLSIPLDKRKELLVTLAQQNPKLVEKSCFK